MFRKLSFALAIAFSCVTIAEETSVYCSDSGRTWEWNWLPDTTVEGIWYRLTPAGENYTIRAFHIEADEYKRLKGLCANYFPLQPDPRPARNMFSDWYQFTYSEKGMIKLGIGYTYHTFPSSKTHNLFTK